MPRPVVLDLDAAWRVDALLREDPDGPFGHGRTSILYGADASTSALSIAAAGENGDWGQCSVPPRLEGHVMFRRLAVVTASAAFVALSAAPAMAASGSASCVGQLGSVEAQTTEPNFGQFVSGEAKAGDVGAFVSSVARYPGDCSVFG